MGTEETKAKIPVYLPYGDGTRVEVGDAVLNGNMVEIELTGSAGERLHDMLTDGMLKGVSFDYGMARPSFSLVKDHHDHTGEFYD